MNTRLEHHIDLHVTFDVTGNKVFLEPEVSTLLFFVFFQNFKVLSSLFIFLFAIN
jgi:hypothetical protein